MLESMLTKYGDVSLSEALAWEKNRKGGAPKRLHTDELTDFYLWVEAFRAKGMSITTAGKWRGLSEDQAHRRYKAAKCDLAKFVDPHLDNCLRDYLSQHPSIASLIEYVAESRRK